ncbi:MAG: hypothetical protein SV375_22230 [Thermodesulfobacteriota bacterium]|nr:hypothetical protein [Thermodesulfobacteriota bacterium]
MATSREKSMPRYVFHVQGHSEPVARLVEVERNYRFTEQSLSGFKIYGGPPAIGMKTRGQPLKLSIQS